MVLVTNVNIVIGIRFLLWVLFFLYGIKPVPAQQMLTHIQVHHVFEIRMERWLLTDPLVFDNAETGWLHIEADHQNAGRISIHATENSTVLVSLEAPDSLFSDNQDTLPFRLESSYVQDGMTNPNLAKPIADNRASFTLSSRGMLIDENFTWLQELKANVFLPVALYLGDVKPGIYTGVVSVTVEYL